MDRFGRMWDHREYLVIAAVLAALIALVAMKAGRPPAPKPAPSPAEVRHKSEPTISLWVAETGQVKRLKLEEYVAGVVAGEMRPDWPREALSAQAILARTFTLRKMERGKTRHGTDASTDVKEFQAYAPEKITPAVREAVEASRGKVITYRGGLALAYFHACAGGMTSTAPEGLAFTKEPTPYLKVVRDDPCPLPSQQNWTATFSREEVLRAARQVGARPAGIAPLRVVRRGVSGRATHLSIGGATVGAAGLRTALGPDRMKSTLLKSLRVEGDRVVMEGKGWGHGVGLSQWGALGKARAGWNAERIIRYYFRDIQVRQLWR